ncbi:RHS repeat-associated core domain-containing protein [Pseudomonas sp.]|uniref:RHS repeat-associated core domain-containing protein n=1 Tax=Pseudomonas sp. TaxID=306 RepID=UPI0028AD0932|nr:RHS repeat-associated core domain-containing protein [Pseudomonas sp.]
MTSNVASESYFFQSGHLATLKSPLREVRFLYGPEACISNIIDSHSASTSQLLRIDQQRSVIGHTLEQTQTYSAYGFSSPFEDFSTLGFSGERLGSEGLYLLGNGYRAYNPGLMRFHSADGLSPFEQGGINAYAYCSNDPINRIDPDGHAFIFTLNLFRSKKTIMTRRQNVIDELAPKLETNLTAILENKKKTE